MGSTKGESFVVERESSRCFHVLFGLPGGLLVFSYLRKLWPFESRGRKNVVYLDERSSNARRILIRIGVSIARDPSQADMLWMRKGYKNFEPAEREFQLLNHIPKEIALTNKGRLTRLLKRHAARDPDEDVTLDAFYPESYRLYSTPERMAFFRRLPAEDDPQNIWILKPTNWSRGRGVKVTWKTSVLRRWAAASGRQYPELDADVETLGIEPSRKYIAQRYLKNVLLLDERKSELRIYWLVACLDPLLVLLYPEGTVRLNTLPYEEGDYENPLVHLGNVYQQKSHPDYDPDAILKWSFAEFEAYLVSEQGSAEPQFLEKVLIPRIERMLRYVVHATRHELENVEGERLYFGLFGADIMLDRQLTPWLTEVQKGPGLGFKDPVKSRVVLPMFREAMRILFEIQERKREGKSLRDLRSVRKFHWVIDES